MLTVESCVDDPFDSYSKIIKISGLIHPDYNTPTGYCYIRSSIAHCCGLNSIQQIDKRVLEKNHVQLFEFLSNISNHIQDIYYKKSNNDPAYKDKNIRTYPVWRIKTFQYMCNGNHVGPYLPNFSKHPHVKEVHRFKSRSMSEENPISLFIIDLP